MGRRGAPAEANQDNIEPRAAVTRADAPKSSFGGVRLASLRARLIASHVSVLLLALGLVLGISAVGLRRSERSAQIEEMRDLAVPLVVEARVIWGGAIDRDAAARASVREQLLTYQAAETETRILVLRPDSYVLFDSAAADSLAGERLSTYQAPVTRLIDSTNGRQNVSRAVIEPPARSDDPFAGQIVVLAAGGRTVAGQPLPRQTALLLVAPPRRQGLTGRFLPPLVLILAVALAVAAVAGYLLSRRIAAPIARLTAATDAMTAGNLALAQTVPESGADEIGRLVTSFNSMSHQVAATYRSQRQLLADIAHELRTPLTSVQGYTRALHDGVLSTEPDRQRALETIGREADRMGRLIRQLLELSRIESGQTRVHLQHIPVRPLLERVKHRFAPEAGRREVAVLVAASTETTALADAERLDQVLDNLLSNALRHTSAGGEIVMAATGTERQGDGETGRRIRITVRDTGQGIAPKRLGRIFERFERGRDVDGREGFGLGLAIARELVHAHGGTIEITSQVGQGTLVTIELPGDTAPTLDRTSSPT